MKTKSLLTLCFILLHSAFILSIHAQGTAFTYQGRLNDNGAAATGVYDLEFRVFDALAAGGQQGSLVTVNDLGVTNGLFTVTLNPGAGVFTGAARWLQHIPQVEFKFGHWVVSFCKFFAASTIG